MTLGGLFYQEAMIRSSTWYESRLVSSSGHSTDRMQWTLPDLPETPVETPLQVHYPHFSTSAIHSGIVDWCESLFRMQYQG